MGLNLSAGLGGQFLTGAGIKIGIISDSFNLNTATGKENPITAGPAQADIKNGLLPSANDIIDLAAGKAVAGGGHDEGRAMAEIIHAIAPGATIVFQTPRVEPQANNVAAFGQAVKDLQAQHVQIIVDDIGLFSGTPATHLVPEPSDPAGRPIALSTPRSRAGFPISPRPAISASARTASRRSISSDTTEILTSRRLRPPIGWQFQVRRR